MSKHKPSDIKRVVDTTKDEILKSELLSTIVKAIGCEVYKSNSGKSGDKNYEFLGNDINGKEFNRKFRTFTYGKFRMGGWDSETEANFVRIHKYDGSWEYGIRYMERRATQIKKELRPIYIQTGVANSYGVVSAPPCTKNNFIPSWVMARLPFYNEKMRERCSGWEYGMLSDDNELKDDISVCDAIRGSMVATEFMTYGVPSNNFKWMKKKVAWKYLSCRSYETEYEPYYTEFVDDGLKVVRGSIYKKGDVADDPSIGIYQYLKSIYGNDKEYRNSLMVIPVKNIFIINKKGYKSDGSDTYEVWNSLDTTLKGIG